MSDKAFVGRILGAWFLCCIVVVPANAAAQGLSAASLSGVVTDTSGAVLPGVTVEASSPVLIEKVRSAVTDERGEYRIVELIPGTYTVTFTLTGFATLRREGLELPPSFNATVSAQLRVGAIEESVTVSGASPLADWQYVGGVHEQRRRAQRDSARGRQPLQWNAVRKWHDQRSPGRQHERRAQGRRRDHEQRDAKGLRRQRRPGRTDRGGQAVVHDG